MPEDLRKKCARRSDEAIAMAHGGCPKRLQKSPSERNSIALRKKLARGVNIKETEVILEDCRDCSKEPCGQTIKTCGVVACTQRCSVCNTKALRRSIPEQPIYICLVCRERL